MVGKPLALVGVVLVVAGIALTIMISVLQEWAIATIQVDEDNIVCTKEDNPLGTLGLYQSTYTPSCTKGSVFEATYSIFEDATYPTTEFWPLFPAQNNFGGIFGDSFKFESCEKTYGTNVSGNALTGAAILPYLNAAAGSLVAASQFRTADAGLASGNAQLLLLADTIFAVIDGAIQSSWETSANSSLPSAERLLYVPTFVGLAAYQGFASIVNETSAACATAMLALADSPTFALDTPLPECVASFTGVSGFAPAYGVNETYSQFVQAIDAEEFSPGTSNDGLAGKATMFLHKALLATCGASDTVVACTLSLAGVGLGDLQALLGYGLSPAAASEAFIDKSFAAQFIKINSTVAGLTDLTEAAIAGGVWAKAYPLFASCVQAGLNTRRTCASTLFTEVQEDMNAEWAFCQFAQASGALSLSGASCGTSCSSLCVLQTLAGAPELLPPAAAAYGSLIPKLVEALEGCAFFDQGFNVCKSFLGAPEKFDVFAEAGGSPTEEALANAVAEQSRIPNDFSVKYGLCLGAMSEKSAMSDILGNPALQANLTAIYFGVTGKTGFNPAADCETFVDAIETMAFNFVVARTFNRFENLTDVDASLSLATLQSVFMKPCFTAAHVTGRASCLAHLAVNSTTGLITFDVAVLQATLENFVTPKAVESGSGFVEACKDDEKDIAAIELAQILVPVAIGAEFVGLLLAILGVAKGNGKLLIVGAVLCIAGVGSAAAGLVNVQQAPMFDLISDSCPDGEACYLGGIAKTLAYGGLALPFVAAILLIISSCMNKGGEETAVSGKVDSY